MDDGLQQRAMLDLRRVVIYCLLSDTPAVFKGMHDNVGVWQTNPAHGVFANLTGLDGKPVEATVNGLYLGLATQYVGIKVGFPFSHHIPRVTDVLQQVMASQDMGRGGSPHCCASARSASKRCQSSVRGTAHLNLTQSSSNPNPNPKVPLILLL